jgi:hypothetical protein
VSEDKDFNGFILGSSVQKHFILSNRLSVPPDWLKLLVLYTDRS